MARDNMQEMDELSEEEILIHGKESETEVSKCPGCGANLTYDPDTQTLKCEHCGTSKAVDFSNNAQEVSFSKIFEGDKNSWGEDTRVIRCNNCGAKTVISRVDITKKCAFCGTSNVIETDELSGLKPNAVLPFLVGKDSAMERIKAWLKKKFFLPRNFKRDFSVEELNGNYIPAFTFDTATSSGYSGRLGKHYTVTVRRNGKTYTETRTKWFHISGCFNMDFDDILVQASGMVEGKHMKKILPFGTNNSQQYSQDFMHGFTASQYTKSGQQCWDEAKTIASDAIRRGILRKYSYDVVDYLNVKTSHNNITFKYLLLPIYIGHSVYSKKTYNLYVNGQNGKVSGKVPRSAWKIGILALAITAIAVGIGVLVMLFGG